VHNIIRRRVGTTVVQFQDFEQPVPHAALLAAVRKRDLSVVSPKVI
jgi:hypothetical protein